ncbi:MAG TPA: PIG-L family deacetylase [Gemmatimonadales bacterium]|nr:PIG-L family deacetylase [Gemmatimonadales bacterium]
MRSSVRRAVDFGFTSLWGGGFWVARHLAAHAHPWDSAGGERVLVVAPHPDDEIAGCGGAILLHAAAGDRVTVLHVTDGRASRALGLDAAAMARRRRQEAEASVQALDAADWQWLGLPEREWKDADLAEHLERVMTDLGPHIVYAPSRVDFHPEHYAVARVLAERRALSAVRAIRIYQVQVPLTRVLVNLTAPIARVRDAARRASAVYRSQETSLRGPWRLKTYAAGEEFWEVTPSAYTRLHAESPPRPLVHTFRGLRRLAVTDPLAYAVGRAERRRLRHLADAP